MKLVTVALLCSYVCVGHSSRSSSNSDRISRRLSKGSKKESGSTLPKQGGIQNDCLENDDRAFNICLDLNTFTGITTVSTFTYNRTTNAKCLTSNVPNGALTLTGSNRPLDQVLNTTYDDWWMDIAIEVQKDVEKLIRDDTVRSYNLIDHHRRVCPPRFPVACGVKPFLSSLALNTTDFIVDDLMITITAGYIGSVQGLSPPPDASAAAVTQSTSSNEPGGYCQVFCPFTNSTPGNAASAAFYNCSVPDRLEFFPNPTIPRFTTTCNILLLENTASPFSSLRGNDELIYKLLFHEFLHCLGLTKPHPIQVEKDYDPIDGNDPDILSQDGLFWVGPETTKLWRKMGCDGNVPLTSGTGLHLDINCISNDLFNEIFGVESRLSHIAGGMLADIGYKVDIDEFHKIGLKDLLPGCGSACTAASITKAPKDAKSPKRRLGRHSTSIKGVPKSKRRLNPAENIPTFTEPFEPDDAEYDEALKFIYSLSQVSGGSPDREVNVLFLAADGTMHDVSTTFKDAQEYVEENGFGTEEVGEESGDVYVRRLFERMEVEDPTITW